MNISYLVQVRCLTFNHAAYIEDTMNGFCIQETTFPFVCTIIDDASSDGEALIIRQYLQDHFDLGNNNIMYKEETNDYDMIFAQHSINKNCYFAVYFLKYNHFSIKKKKNTYIKDWNDKVKYIALCEGDDYWILPNKLQKQAMFMEKNTDYSLCGTNGLVIWENLVNNARYFNNIIKDQEMKPEHIIGHWIMPTASIFYRKDIMLRLPAWSSSIISGDQLTILIAMNYGKIYMFRDLSCIYRKLEGGSILGNIVTKKYHQRNIYDMYLGFSEYSNHKFDDIIIPYLKKKKKELIPGLKEKVKESDLYKVLKHRFIDKIVDRIRFISFIEV